MNDMYAAERHEYRRALAAMTEMERAAAEPDRPDRYGLCGDDAL